MRTVTIRQSGEHIITLTRKLTDLSLNNKKNTLLPISYFLPSLSTFELFIPDKRQRFISAVKVDLIQYLAIIYSEMDVTLNL